MRQHPLLRLRLFVPVSTILGLIATIEKGTVGMLTLDRACLLRAPGCAFDDGCAAMASALVRCRLRCCTETLPDRAVVNEVVDTFTFSDCARAVCGTIMRALKAIRAMLTVLAVIQVMAWSIRFI